MNKVTPATVHPAGSRPGWAAHLPPTDDQLEEIAAVFVAMQPNDGFVDYYKVKAALRGMGFAVRKQELLQLLAQCCPHVADDQRMSQDDFASLVLRYAARRSPQEQLAHDFALLDTNGKGYIDASDLKMIAKTLPSETRVTDADIACMIQMITSVHGPTKGTLAQARIGLEEFATAVGAAR